MAVLLMGAGLLLAHCCKGTPDSAEPTATPATPRAERAGKAGKAGKAGRANPAAAGTQTMYDIHFGMNGGLYPRMPARNGAEAMREITNELGQLGMVWLRNPGRGNSWWEIQPDRDTFNFSKLDAVLDGNEHPWILTLYGQLGVPYPFSGDFSPEKLKSGGRVVHEAVKKNPLTLSDPQHKADAERYIKTTVETYKDRIKHWEIGNEGINSPNRLEVVQHTYTWIKEVDPEALVILTAPAGSIDERYHRSLDSVDRLMEGGAGQSFDIGNLHYYGEVGSGFEDRLVRAYDAYAEILAKHGVDKPIWVTETGASSEPSSVVSGPSSEAVQARQMVKRMVLFSAQGAEKVLWHDYATTGATSQFGGCNVIDERSREPKPAYHAFKLLVDKIGWYTTAETLQSDGTYLYRFTNPDGGVVLVGWSHNPNQIDLNAYLGSKNASITRITEKSGSTSTVETVSASSVPLGVSPIFIEPS